MAIHPLRTLIARWPDGRPEDVPVLKSCGVEAVLEEDAARLGPELQRAEIAVCPSRALPEIVSHGLWPGVRSEPRTGDSDETASASREPWVDSNGYLVYFERALHPQRPAVLGYRANQEAGLDGSRVVPFDSLELAYAEARLAGGNYLLSFDPRFREALRVGDAKAKAAAASLARTHRWFRTVEPWLGRAVSPTVIMLVEPGDTLELANLGYRRGVSPRLVALAELPAPDPNRILVVSAASLKQVPATVYDHARAGSTVVIDSPPDPSWKLIKQESDRRFFSLGKGQVVAYQERIVDPSEYALDLNDLVSYRRRPVRIWNALAAIVVATEGVHPRESVAYLINYGAKVEQEVQLRIQGHFARAELLRPEDSAPRSLKISKRGTMSEVFLPDLLRVAIIRFEQ
ncbi:MAG: hypothetical protein NZV14_04905 [Bryobacteraceae bacterium]|nr:hypothetical protein [Bryobacteraceae bacterium]MDW8377474.1 hypothetical protein [Bryobacterales bacterium]